MSSSPSAEAIALCMSSAGCAVTFSSFSVSPGSIVYDGSIPSPAYLVKVSSVTMLITVSRCMNARFCGIASATIRCAEPLANRRFASRSMPWAVVRSLIPTSTAPWPRTWMSPPSVVATPLTRPSDHTWKAASANSGCHR